MPFPADNSRKTPNWPGIMDVETITRSGLEKDLDLELFPDLQCIKHSDIKVSSNDATLDVEDAFDCVGDMDSDLLNYLNRENVPATSTSPLELNVNKGASAGRIVPRLKVVTLKQGISRGGKIVVVEPKQKVLQSGSMIIEHIANMNSLYQGKTQMFEAGPSSPTSSNGDTESQSGALCMSKNAIAARENRLRKKQNVEKLETWVSELSSENQKLKTDMSEMTSDIESLKNEVKYLRAVLANQSTIARLLKNIPSCGVDLSNSDRIKTRGSRGTEKVSKAKGRKRPAMPMVEIESDSEVEVETIESEEECDCHPDKNVCMCTKENRHKPAKDDHSYANGSIRNQSASGPSTRKRRRPGAPKSSSNDEGSTTPGVCLHVSGESVSLEFCSTCSSKAATSKKPPSNN